MRKTTAARRPVILAAVAVAFAGMLPGEAFAYDDPAVAVCEYAITRGRTAPEIEYERNGAGVAGATVTLHYSWSAINIAPKDHQVVCYFKRHGPSARLSRYYLSAVIPAAYRSAFEDCEAELVQLAAKLEHLRPGDRGYTAASSARRRCEGIQKTINQDWLNRREDVQNTLRALDVYPIMLEDTDLTGPGPAAATHSSAAN